MPLFVTVFDFDDDLVHSQQMANSNSFTVEQLSTGSLDLEAGSARIVVRSAAGDQ